MPPPPHLVPDPSSLGRHRGFLIVVLIHEGTASLTLDESRLVKVVVVASPALLRNQVLGQTTRRECDFLQMVRYQ